MNSTLASCHCCGLVQRLPGTASPGRRAVCRRCRTPFSRGRFRGNRVSTAWALGALILYLPALILPMLRVEELGHATENSLWGGVVAMLGEGHWLIGMVVLLFSIVFPLVKLVCLLLLGSRRVLGRSEHRAVVYRLVEAVGRWGMLDVMLVAVFLAYVKLGDLLAITPGPGVAAFSAMVIMSLLAGMTFDPHVLWHEPERGRT